MAKSKKDKKKKKKQKQLEQVQLEQTKYDIIELLKNEQLDTKPNLAKFLNTYVKSITAPIENGKIQFYPTLQYSLLKIFVKFLDGHELIYFYKAIPNQLSYYMYDGLEEIQIKQKDIKAIEQFFKFLVDFNFVHQ